MTSGMNPFHLIQKRKTLFSKITPKIVWLRRTYYPRLDFCLKYRIRSNLTSTLDSLSFPREWVSWSQSWQLYENELRLWPKFMLSKIRYLFLLKHIKKPGKVVHRFFPRDKCEHFLGLRCFSGLPFFVPNCLLSSAVN